MSHVTTLVEICLINLLKVDCGDNIDDVENLIQTDPNGVSMRLTEFAHAIQSLTNTPTPCTSLFSEICESRDFLFVVNFYHVHHPPIQSSLYKRLLSSCAYKTTVDIRTLEWLSNQYNVRHSITDLQHDFVRICKSNRLELAKWYCNNLNFRLHECLIRAFRVICVSGALEVGKWLAHMIIENSSGRCIPIEPLLKGFQIACEYCHEDVANWLFSFSDKLVLAGNDELMANVLANGSYEFIIFVYEKAGVRIGDWVWEEWNRPRYLDNWMCVACKNKDQTVPIRLYDYHHSTVTTSKPIIFTGAMECACTANNLQTVDWLISMNAQLLTDVANNITEEDIVFDYGSDYTAPIMQQVIDQLFIHASRLTCNQLKNIAQWCNVETLSYLFEHFSSFRLLFNNTYFLYQFCLSWRYDAVVWFCDAFPVENFDYREWFNLYGEPNINDIRPYIMGKEPIYSTRAIDRENIQKWLDTW